MPIRWVGLAIPASRFVIQWSMPNFISGDGAHRPYRIDNFQPRAYNSPWP